MKRGLVALLVLLPALMGQRATDIPVYNKRRLDALLSRDNCTREGGCDLASGTTIGGSPIGGGGAPTTADYLVGTAQAGLSSEIVFGAAVASQCVTGVSGGAVTRSQPDFSWLTGTATDAQVSGGNEEDEIDLLDLRDSAAAGGCTGSQQVRRNAGDTAWECFTASAGGMTSFDADGDNNAPQTVGNAQELQILGGTNGVDTAASATRTITVNLDLSEAAAGGELGGTMDAPTIDDGITIGGITLNASPTITLTQGTGATPVIEGVIEWDSDDDHIMVGASGSSVRFIPAEDFSADATVSASGAVTIANDSHDHTTTTISGLDGGDITAGTVVAARIDGAMATDAEVAAGYQPLDPDLTSVAALSTTAGGRSILATTPGDDQVYVGDSASAGTWRSIGDCDNPTTSKLLYDTTTNAFSCGTDQGGGGGGISYADAAAAALAGF